MGAIGNFGFCGIAKARKRFYIKAGSFFEIIQRLLAFNISGVSFNAFIVVVACQLKLVGIFVYPGKAKIT